jgi:hypothetical protein
MYTCMNETQHATTAGTHLHTPLTFSLAAAAAMPYSLPNAEYMSVAPVMGVVREIMQ